jgi:hypothetical protein
MRLERGIEKELKQVEQKRQRSTVERYVEAMDDADDLLECYRRIQRLLERLAVRSHRMSGYDTEMTLVERERERMEDC